ncbi:MAG: hypothetical protein HRT35_23485, partial [Algicola sp.]|nr:hypothetical protein [Algicola sp.]
MKSKTNQSSFITAPASKRVRTFPKNLITVLLMTTLTACGGGGTVTPIPTNQAPVAVAGSDQAVNEQVAVTLSGSATDSDGTISTYQWIQIS